jgi:hypothetical protein
MSEEKGAPTSLFLYLNEDSDWHMRYLRSQMDCLILEYAADRLSRNVGTSTLRRFPKQRRSHLHRGGSLESRKIQAVKVTQLWLLPAQLTTAVWSIHMKIENTATVRNCSIVGWTHDHNCDMRLSLWSLMLSIFNNSVSTSHRKRLHFIRRSIGVGTQPEPVCRSFD